MRGTSLNAITFFAVVLGLLSINALAQDSAPVNNADKKTEATTQATAPDASVNAAKKAEPNSSQPAKKMVQDASITLQTTITGNQEQPRVLYILPWQSPMAANVDFESLDNEQKAVFGHVEREELRRELEASDEVK